MKKFTLVATFIFSLLILSSLSFAQNLKIGVSDKDMTAYGGETKIIEITVFNNQNYADGFSITVYPQYFEGITANLENYILPTPSNSNSTTKLYVKIPDCPEEVTRLYTITVRSRINDAVNESKTISINIKRKNRVCLSDLTTDKQVLNAGETIKIMASITNPEATSSSQFYLRTSILRGSEAIESFDDRIETVSARSTQKINHAYTFDKYISYGCYTVEATLKDNLGSMMDSKKVDLRITSTENITFVKTSAWGLLGQTIAIKVKNEGNNASTGIIVTETVPIFLKPFFFPKTEPKTETAKDNRIIYVWLIDRLEAGEEKTITYKIDITNAWIIVLALIAVTVYSFRYVFTLSLVKKHKYARPLTKEKEVTILLEARNRTRHLIKDVQIRDFVPSIATVVEKFDTIRPVVRKAAGGTELVWKLDFLRPREERVITYRLRPVVDVVGTLKLPNAYMRYETKKKEIKRVVSKSTFMKQT